MTSYRDASSTLAYHAIAHIQKGNKFTLEIGCEGLSESQIRLIRTLHTNLIHVLNTENESEFFNGSAELMRSCAATIKQAQFSKKFESKNIPYAQQALEYSIDVLQENIEKLKVVIYDN